MTEPISRRDLLRILGVSGLAAGLEGLVWPAGLRADPPKAIAPYPVLIEGKKPPAFAPASVVDGKVIQPQRELPVLHKTDVLVVGGGPAGVAAAISAKRAGANVAIVERYGHFGGQWTGGLVLLVIGHIVKGNKQVCQGIGEEMMQRLDKIEGGIIGRRPGSNPTVDAEALKYVMLDMLVQAGVKIFLHCWGVDAIMEGPTVQGAIFESKAGRQAILAKAVVDATGDGDLLGAAGVECEYRKYQIGLVSRIGNVDKVDAQKAKQGPRPRNLGAPTPVAGVNWVNLRGPDADGLDVEDLTRLEINHRRFIWQSVQKIRQVPGYEKVYLMETAPQLGVRITRVLAGLSRITRKGLTEGTRYPDTVAVGGACNCEHGEWQVRYGCLVPKKIENILAAGRCISFEPQMTDLVRLIPNCFASGHAAGAAAAVAVQDGCRVRDVDVAKVQRLLKQQEAYLG